MWFKHSSKIVAACALMLAVSSCSDKALEVIPPDATDTDALFTSAKDLNEVLNGSYDALSYGTFMGGLVQLTGELPADNIDPLAITNGDWKACYDRNTGIRNQAMRDIFSNGYKAIGRANYVLDNLDRLNPSADERARMEGGAKFIRAIGHFELVRLVAQPYGFTGAINGVSYSDNGHPGIPLRVRFSSEQLARATVKEVYAQIIADLKDAEATLPETSSLGYATKDAARGYLAKVYFQMNDFANAYLYADRVISTNKYALDSLNGRFSANWSSETVFGLYSSLTNNDNSAGFYRDNIPYDANRDAANVGWSNGIYNLVKVGDLRGTKWFKSSKGLNFSTKFPAGVLFHNPLCHLTELKLIRAEAIAEGGGGSLATAIQDLNDIHNRAGITLLDGSTSAAGVIADARQQRRIELYAEGNRVHDLKRQAVRSGDPNFSIRNAVWTCNGLVFQIPDSELTGNLNIAPNPVGGCN